jgi:UDP-GlcNAc:undecaprenyl-phosphate GlcNAc-1-phosphate transferase
MRGLIGLALATGIVFLATPYAIRTAARFDFFDRPAGYKGHAAPTPYLGGAPVVAAFVVVLLLLANDPARTLPIGAGAIVLWVLGTVDDRRTVSPSIRVGAEAGLAAMLAAAGLGWQTGAGSAVDLVLTVVWVVGVVNALNLFDNMDGSASSIALVISAAVGVIGIAHGDVWLAVAGLGLAGACLGFLPHNLSTPARIFLGDGGSMPIGFAIAAMVMSGAGAQAPAWQALAVGVLLVGIPAVDTCLVIASRKRRGVPIVTPGRDHLTHRTFQRLRTTRAVAIALGGTQALLAALALLASRQSTGVLVFAVIVYLVGAATAIIAFDSGTRAEAREAAAEAGEPALAVGPGAGAGRRIEAALLVIAGLGAGLSPFFLGFYHPGTWVPIGLVVLVLATAAWIARPGPLSPLGLAAVGGIAGLGLLSLLSSSWSGSAETAVVNGNRLLTYAAFLALLLALVRSRTAALVVLGSFLVGALAVAVADTVRMLSGDTTRLFISGRINAPLGYINGQGNFFLLAAWPCVALACQRKRTWLAAIGLGAATLFGCLALLAESRGVALAAVASIVVVMVAVPGRLRRAAALLTMGAGIAVAAPALKDVFTEATPAGSAADPVLHHAAIWMIAASVGVAAIWGVALAVEAQLRRRGDYALDNGRLAVAGVLAVIVLGGVGAAAVKAGSISHTVSNQYHQFVHLAPSQTPDGSRGRLVSGGGNRYDYWRVAADQWSSAPIAGTGAGSYPEHYFRERRTSEDIRQPHSIELEVLGDLGLLGAALLLLAMCAVLAAAYRRRREARESGTERALLAAAVGVVVAWGAQTSVDWMHLLPGLTGAALIGAAVLLRPGAAPRPSRSSTALRAVRVVAVAAVVALAATSLSRELLADYSRTKGQDALAASPADALRWANRSLKLDGDAVSTYYLKAAAIARFGSADQSLATLRQAIAREPGNFLTYALVGDLYVRQGRLADAKRAYGQALARNPRDAGLQALARDPASAAPNGVR